MKLALWWQFSNVGSLDLHGFARTRFWSIDNEPQPSQANPTNRVFVDLIYKSTEEDLTTWPHR